MSSIYSYSYPKTQSDSNSLLGSQFKRENSKDLGVLSRGELAQKFQQDVLSKKTKELGEPLKGESLGKVLGKKTMDKDDFLKLFLAQLKNQDPMQPRDSHDLATQLAQFSSLEKLENIESGIQALGGKRGSQSDYRVLDLIGKVVTGDLSQIKHSGKEHLIHYDLPEKANEVKIEVLNSKGEVVRKWTLVDQDKGVKSLQWDGLKEDGTPLPHETYQLRVQYKSLKGEELEVQMNFKGQVSGVNFTGEDPLLILGERSVKLSEVRRIFSSHGPSPETSTPPIRASKEENEDATYKVKY